MGEEKKEDIIKKPLVISVDGNIGSGKSTFIKKLKECLDDAIYIVEEPVNFWTAVRDEDGKNLLELFYHEKSRWGYTLQNYAYITRLLNIKKASNFCSSSFRFLSISFINALSSSEPSTAIISSLFL